MWRKAVKLDSISMICVFTWAYVVDLSVDVCS